MNLIPEQDLSDDELQALLREDFATFVQVYYKTTKSAKGLIWAPYLDLLCAKLQAVADGSIKKLIVTMPPRYLKSFTVSVCLPAFILGRDQTQQVMCVSYGQALANDFARDCRTIMNHPTYTEAFGKVLDGPRQPLDAMRTSHGGVRRATSIDGTATGFGNDLLIIDDPQKPGEVTSDSVRQKINEAYEKIFFSRSNDQENSRVIIVMQRLHNDDMVSHVQSLSKDWEVVNLPAIAEDDEMIPFSTFMGQQAFRRGVGEALHPARVSLETLHTIRSTMGSANFAQQYQQRPMQDGGELVKTDWFPRYRPDDLPAKFDEIIQSWDTASTINEWSDYSACTTWGVLDRHVYLLHVYRSRMIYPDLKRVVIEQAVLHKATTIYIEDHSSGTQLLQELRAQGFGQFRGVKQTRDKKTRMVNQTALIEAGYVHVPEAAPWLEGYLYELAVFPDGKNDDRVDSTSQALHAINTWADNRGLLEFYRQETEPQRRAPSNLWVVRPPLGQSMIMDREGFTHYTQDDGCFHLKLPEQIFNGIGWTIVSRPPP